MKVFNADEVKKCINEVDDCEDKWAAIALLEWAIDKRTFDFELCEDAISREAAIQKAEEIIRRDNSGNNAVVEAMKAWKVYIKCLPSVSSKRSKEARRWKRIALKYKQAFKIACDLMLGGHLFGYDEDTIFEEIMNKQGVVSSLDYEKYILSHLDELSGRNSDV